MGSPGTIHVLVVDDSAVARQVLTALLATDPAFSVTVAADPLVAKERMKASRPDVILLDLEMPRMDGLTFLRQIMASAPIPVVVCSAATGRGTAAALQALASGAVEVVEKPRLERGDEGAEHAAILCEAVRAAASARLHAPIARPAPAAAPRMRAPVPGAAGRPHPEVVIAIGASTGGTEAIASILRDLPGDGPPILIVQHMASPFTGPFARALARTSPMDVREACNGDVLGNGTCLVAPGNLHMRLVRRAPRTATGEGDGPFHVELWDGPRVSRHRPSVDVLFSSVARAAGPAAIGVLLTGMGDDGASGLLEMRAAGAVTIGQDEATSVVYGMPGQARRRGAVVHELPLPRIAPTLATLAGGRRSAPRRGA